MNGQKDWLTKAIIFFITYLKKLVSIQQKVFCCFFFFFFVSHFLIYLKFNETTFSLKQINFQFFLSHIQYKKITRNYIFYLWDSKRTLPLVLQPIDICSIQEGKDLTWQRPICVMISNDPDVVFCLDVQLYTRTVWRDSETTAIKTVPQK